MHPAEIKAALEIAGSSQAQVARDCEVSRSVVNDVVNGRGRSQQVEARISVITGRFPHELWPQWYGAAGKEMELVTPEERLLLRSYRVLSDKERLEALRRVQALEVGHVNAGPTITASGSNVIATGDGSVAAGRGVHYHGTPRKKRGK